jgi:hypothetical protein
MVLNGKRLHKVRFFVTFFARETFPKRKRAKKKGTAPRLLFHFAGKGWPCAAGLCFRREITPGGILCRFFVPFSFGILRVFLIKSQ